MDFIYILSGVAIGLFIGWYLIKNKFDAKLASLQTTNDKNLEELTKKDEIIEKLRNENIQLVELKARLDAQVKSAGEYIQEQRRLLSEAEQKFKEVFNSLASEVLKSSSTEFLKLAQEKLATSQAEAKGEIDLKKEEIKSLVAPLADALKNYEENIRRIEEQRQNAYGGINVTLRDISETQKQLQLETTNLVNALRRPQVKGRWGEITLRRVVELAGMSEYCDFETQLTVETDDGKLRPDMVVRLPSKRSVVVDAKVSLSAYMDAMSDGVDEAARVALFQKHAQQLRAHMRDLSSKAYWNQFTSSPDFVVMFLPADSFLSAALEHDRSLIEDGFENRVVLATPATLVALLKAVAYGWKQEQLTENAQKIADEGKILFERLSKFVEFLENIRKSLEKATESFNQAVSSWDSRVMPSARRLKELGASSPDREIEGPESIEVVPRSLPPTETKV